MTTDLIVADGFDLSELAAELGTAKEGSSGARLPQLRTNRRLKDENKNMLPLGEFYLTGQDKLAFAKEVKFRPLSHHFQYVHYDAETEKYVNWTRQVANFKEELRDIKGGIRCGRPDNNILNKMSREEKQKYRPIKNIRLIRGLVSFVGKTVDGEEVVYENQPCMIKLSGQNNFQSTDKGVYSRFDEQVRNRIPRGYELWNFELTITSDEHSNEDGSTFWHTMEYDFNPKAPIAVDQKIYDSIVFITEMVRAENAEVDAAYANAIRDAATAAGAIDALGGALEDDFEDVA